MHFISSAYGNSYFPLLAIFLYSIHANCPGSSVAVYWQDMDEDLIKALERIFPRLTCVKTTHTLIGSNHQKISSKMLLWQQALTDYTGSEDLCLIDSDTLVQRNPATFLQDADIIFTDKNEPFQLNTGVVLFKKNHATLHFFKKWVDLTAQIVQNPSLLEEAISPANSYGGGDQMALHQLIQYQPHKKEYQISTPAGEIRLRAIPCRVLNETNSVPLSPDIYIYHYKGGWRHILFEGIYSPMRTQKDSLPMLIKYIQTFHACMNMFRQAGVAEETLAKIHLHIPPFFHKKTGRFLPIKYWLEQITQNLKSYWDK